MFFDPILYEQTKNQREPRLRFEKQVFQSQNTSKRRTCSHSCHIFPSAPLRAISERIRKACSRVKVGEDISSRIRSKALLRSTGLDALTACTTNPLICFLFSGPRRCKASKDARAIERRAACRSRLRVLLTSLVRDGPLSARAPSSLLRLPGRGM